MLPVLTYFTTHLLYCSVLVMLYNKRKKKRRKNISRKHEASYDTFTCSGGIEDRN